MIIPLLSLISTTIFFSSTNHSILNKEESNFRGDSGNELSTSMEIINSRVRIMQKTRTLQSA